MKKHLLLLFCLVSSLMALAESEIVNIQTDVKLSASSQAEANIYTIRLSNTNLYFSTKEVADGRSTTYSLSSTPEEFFIEPVDDIPGCYKITGVNGKNVGIGAIYWDFGNRSDALWEIKNLEGLPTQIIRDGTTTGFGPDVAEEGKGVFTNKADVLWQVERANYASGRCGNNLTWELRNGELIISGTGAMTDYNLPYSKTPWDSYLHSISRVIINNGVTSIGNFAFSGCNRLISISIPNSVTRIGNNAFAHCRLASFSIPNAVTSIGVGAFQYCTDLTSITIPNSVTSIGSNAFYYCNELNTVNVSCSDINDFSRYLKRTDIKNVFHSENLSGKEHNIYIAGALQTNIAIPNSLTSIGEHAFDRCTNLVSVNIPNSVARIYNVAFWGCSNLISINIPSSITYIGEKAFTGCNNLKSVHITDLAKWCDIEFGGFDSNPTYYSHKLILNGAEVTKLEIPQNISRVRDYAFINCDGIKSVDIPNSVTSLGNSTFASCDGLTSVNTGNGVENILANCFNGCLSLRKLTIGENVSNIGSQAFLNDNLEEIYAYPLVPPTCGDNVFDQMVYAQATLYVPTQNNAELRYRATDVWKNFIIMLNIEPVGVNAIISTLPSGRNYYNLQGQHTTDASRGISIVNGKKMLTH